MKAKDIIKSPVYIVTVIICIVLATAVAVMTLEKEPVGNADSDAEFNKGSCTIDTIYSAVLDEINVDEAAVESFSITKQAWEGHSEAGAAQDGGFQYEVSLICETQRYTVTVIAFPDGTIEITETVCEPLGVSPEDEKENTPSQTSSTSSKSSSPQTSKPEQPDSKYASVELVKERVLMDTQLRADQVTFLSVTLDENTEPPMYEIIFETLDGYRKYIYHANAITGLLHDRTYYNIDDVYDEDNIFLHSDGDSGNTLVEKIWDEFRLQGHQSFYDEPVYPEGYEP
ncbi:MAG: hypothetical protein HFE73_04940 [Firmicutes bacterium]|nr:hypothetical protein [Bacillota bacterium]